MFGAKYSRSKFWIISIVLLALLFLVNLAEKVLERSNDYEGVIFLYMISLFIIIIWTITLSNRIRDYGSNPWIALLAFIPLVNIILAVYYGIARSKNK